MNQLTARLQVLRDLLATRGREAHFTDEYSQLLGELTAAMTLMRELAMLQGSWLQGQLRERGRFN